MTPSPPIQLLRAILTSTSLRPNPTPACLVFMINLFDPHALAPLSPLPLCMSLKDYLFVANRLSHSIVRREEDVTGLLVSLV